MKLFPLRLPVMFFTAWLENWKIRYNLLFSCKSIFNTLHTDRFLHKLQATINVQSIFKVTRPRYFWEVPPYFEALWYPHLYFYRKSNT